GVKDKKPIYLEPKNPSTLPFIFLSVILVLLLSYSILFTGENYRAPQSLAEAKTALISMEEHLRYGGKKIEGLSSGDLSKTHSLEYEEAPALTITMEKPAVMHLRGFIGSVYEEGKWKELEKEAYGGEYVGLMKWLEDKNFWPQAQMNNLYRMNEASEFATIKIKNNNASRKYFYAPYEISLSDDAAPKKVNYQQDNLSRTKGIGGDKNYEYKVFYPSLGEYSSATAEAWLAQLRQSPDYPAYEEAEKVYRKFVYDTYLRVPEEEKENLAVLGVEACRDKTIDYILYYLRNQFTQNYRYDIEYAGAPEGKDELSYFVNQSRIGNDMHFNTAATLLLREAGIPARYVEGYYLSEAFMFYYEDMVNFEFEIPDSLSHGWVEIYVDELGWQPVEMTPGFYNVDKEQIEQEQDTDQIKEFDQATYPDEVEFNLPGEVDKAAAVKKLIIKKILPILAILLVILAVELCGRLWLKRRKAGFAQEGRKSVMQMYRYICTLMKFDKLDIKKDPRGKVGLAEEAYDGFTRNSFEEILSLIYDVRFGNRSLEEEEHKKIARYTEELGNGIYKKQRRIKRLIMRFVRFIY
ncbi:MAG: transglutaminase domain-containing protein, partial [Anaerovoracaceae bacterium]